MNAGTLYSISIRQDPVTLHTANELCFLVEELYIMINISNAQNCSYSCYVHSNRSWYLCRISWLYSVIGFTFWMLMFLGLSYSCVGCLSGKQRLAEITVTTIPTTFQPIQMQTFDMLNKLQYTCSRMKHGSETIL